MDWRQSVVYTVGPARSFEQKSTSTATEALEAAGLSE